MVGEVSQAKGLACTKAKRQGMCLGDSKPSSLIQAESGGKNEVRYIPQAHRMEGGKAVLHLEA